MGSTLFSKAYQAIKAQYSAAKTAHPPVTPSQKRSAAHVHAKDVHADLIETYRDKYGSDHVAVMYVKKNWQGKKYVSPTPPLFSPGSAARKYRNLLKDMGIPNPATEPVERIRQLREAAQLQKNNLQNDEDLALTSTLESASESEDHSTCLIEDPVPPSPSANGLAGPAPNAAVAADPVWVQREKKLNDAIALMRDFHHGKPCSPDIAEAIRQAQTPDAHGDPEGLPEPIGFPCALVLALPTPPDTSPNIGPAAKLDYYLHNTDLSAQLDPAQLRDTKRYYLERWAIEEQASAAIPV